MCVEINTLLFKARAQFERFDGSLRRLSSSTGKDIHVSSFLSWFTTNRTNYAQGIHYCDNVCYNTFSTVLFN